MARLEPAPAVVLIDMNRLFGEIPLFLGMEHVFNWVDVSKNISRLDASYLSGILYKHRSGLRVLPSPDRVDEEFTVTPQIIETLLQFMRTMFDYIIIDSGQSVDDISKMILRLSDKVLLVCVQSLPCLINVKKILNTFHNLGYPPEPSVEVIVNRFDKKTIISLKEAEESIGKKASWVIPNDYQTVDERHQPGQAAVRRRRQRRDFPSDQEHSGGPGGQGQIGSAGKGKTGIPGDETVLRWHSWLDQESIWGVDPRLRGDDSFEAMLLSGCM